VAAAHKAIAAPTAYQVPVTTDQIANVHKPDMATRADDFTSELVTED
jgi:hypothetical protein